VVRAVIAESLLLNQQLRPPRRHRSRVVLRPRQDVDLGLPLNVPLYWPAMGAILKATVPGRPSP
jgi:hypothetical protein